MEYLVDDSDAGDVISVDTFEISDAVYLAEILGVPANEAEARLQEAGQ